MNKTHNILLLNIEQSKISYTALLFGLSNRSEHCVCFSSSFVEELQICRCCFSWQGLWCIEFDFLPKGYCQSKVEMSQYVVYLAVWFSQCFVSLAVPPGFCCLYFSVVIFAEPTVWFSQCFVQLVVSTVHLSLLSYCHRGIFLKSWASSQAKKFVTISLHSNCKLTQLNFQVPDVYIFIK